MNICFLYIFSAEDEEEGFVLRENVGLRLKALEYWRCYETGLYCKAHHEGDVPLRLVIGEPITAIGELEFICLFSSLLFKFKKTKVYFQKNLGGCFSVIFMTSP